MHRYGDERHDVIWSHSFAVATFIFETTFDCISIYHTTFKPCVKRQDRRAPVRPAAGLAGSCIGYRIGNKSGRPAGMRLGWPGPRMSRDPVRPARRNPHVTEAS